MAITIPRGKIGVTEVSLPENERTILLNPNDMSYSTDIYIHPTAHIKSNLDERRRCLIEFHLDRADGGDTKVIAYPIKWDGSGSYLDPYGEITFSVPINRNDFELKPQDPYYPRSVFGTRTLSARIRIDEDHFFPNLPFEHDVTPATCTFQVKESEPRVARCSNPDGKEGKWECVGSTKFTCVEVNKWGDLDWRTEYNSPDCIPPEPEPVDPPVAKFKAAISLTDPFKVTCTDTSTNSPTSWEWDFGDGTTSTDQNPIHTYTTIGAYTIKLVVTNEGGSSSAQVGIVIEIPDEPPIAEPPVASFLASRSSGTAPLPVIFTDTSIGSPSEWYWDFGDGTFSTDRHVSHTFTDGGTYEVTLSVSNDAGDSEAATTIQAYRRCTDPDGVHGNTKCVVYDMCECVDGTWEIRAENSAQCGYPKPKASFTHARIDDNYRTIQFTDTSDNYPTDWLWRFGDGQTSTDRNPTHTYEQDGIYTVTLVASNHIGDSTAKYPVVVAEDSDSTTPKTLDEWIEYLNALPDITKLGVAAVGVGVLVFLMRR